MPEQEYPPDSEIGHMCDEEIVGLQGLWGACSDPACLWYWCGDMRRRSPVAELLVRAMQAPTGDAALAIIEAAVDQVASQYPGVDRYSI